MIDPRQEGERIEGRPGQDNQRFATHLFVEIMLRYQIPVPDLDTIEFRRKHGKIDGIYFEQPKGFVEHLAALEGRKAFGWWGAVSNHFYRDDFLPVGGYRESVARYSTQIILHRQMEMFGSGRVIEMDIDPNNPDFGFWYLVRHGVDIAIHQGKKRPVNLRRAAKWLSRHRNINVRVRV